MKQAGSEAQNSARQSFEGEKFLALNLDDFSIYRPHTAVKSHRCDGLEEKVTANQLISIHEVDRRGSSHWFFDGFVCHGQHRKYVERIPCTNFSIGGFEDTSWHTVGSSIWIQSQASRKLNLWYCLRRPSAEYKRFHEPFLWIADLAKHLVDYINNHSRVSLIQLREHFSLWLKCTHDMDINFQQWLKTYGDNDFRRIVAAHAEFLYNQAALLGKKYTLHPLWGEIDPFTMNAVPRQTKQIKTYEPIAAADHAKVSESVSRSKTVVTPFVYECFRHLPWARFLDVQRPSTSRQKRPYSTSSPSTSFRPVSKFGREIIEVEDPHSSSGEERQIVRIGDVVAVKSDSQTEWKSTQSLWYGFVQGTRQSKRGVQMSLIWLYRASDTACQSMRYPFENELFLSDHCNCGDKPIYAHEIVSKPKVAFFGSADTPNADFFVRQKYNEADSAWVTLKTSDFDCICTAPKNRKTEDYSIGTTYLVENAHSKSNITLEAVEIVEHLQSSHKIRIRRLARRTSYGDQDAAPNELVYTSRIEKVSTSVVCRPCHVRFYTIEDRKGGRIPVPYCRDGVGDFYYITSSENSETIEADLVPLTTPWSLSLKQGYDPSSITSRSKMRGLDIFCGGGSFGRGLEEGGALEMKWAVDYFPQAIHTYNANADPHDDIKLYYGSVNDYLSQAMRGKETNGNLIAQSGEVEFIAAGSPCQGFSQSNLKKGTDRSLINISMVASVVSFVDFYRPKYALLENVLGMAKCGPKDKNANVFAQVLCALVGLGYQVRPFILDAWSFGSPQSRTRIFISIAAPGLASMPDPPQSHSHPEHVKSRALGKTANGLPLGERYWGATPFKYMSIKEATRDLPFNKDGKVDCIPFPDHRNTRHISSINQTRICNIPKHPRGMAFVTSANLGWQAETQMKAWSWEQSFRGTEKSRAWKRVFPDGLLPTVTTACAPEDGISGQWLHWDADRPITIMEARRAQGFPDHEVIVGAPMMQWKIIGNSVARPVALALGVALRKAWLDNSDDDVKEAGKQFAHDLEIARRTTTLAVVIPKVARRTIETSSRTRDVTDTPDPLGISETEQSDPDEKSGSSSFSRVVTRETTTTSEVTVKRTETTIETRKEGAKSGDQYP